MKLQDKFSGVVYEAEVFDGSQLDALHIQDADLHKAGFQIEVDSPSGDKVQMLIDPGALILVDPDGRVTVAHQSLIGAQFEEVVNG